MTTTTLKPLTETQMLVLTNAAQRSNRFVIPLPATVHARGSVKRNLLLALLKMKMIQESVVDDAAIAWRTDDDGKHLVLHLTPGGYLSACPPVEVPTADASVILADPVPAGTSANDNGASATVDVTKPEAPMRPPTGKLGQVLQAISGDAGATLSEITALTGWLPHTARAAVTGLRQRGYPIQLIETDGRKAYRRPAAA
jgi:hypothetical protein